MSLSDLRTHNPKAFNARYNNYIPHLKSRFYAHLRYPVFIQSIVEDVSFIADEYGLQDTLLWRHEVAMSLMRCCAKIMADILQKFNDEQIKSGSKKGKERARAREEAVFVDERLRAAMDDADHMLRKIVLEMLDRRVKGKVVQVKTTFDEELRGFLWVVERDGRFFGGTFGLVDSFGIE